MFFKSKPTTIPSASEALPGRPAEVAIAAEHFVHGQPIKGPYPVGSETIYLGLGCFWGAERLFWQVPGVVVTAVVV
jgi:peptide-methionine (S)-S-oxide reductase